MFPRELSSHRANQCNDGVGVTVVDDPGSGGAHHAYDLHLLSAPAPEGAGITGETWTTKIRFQKGGIKESGVNGVTNEALLAVVEDRLKCFQSGPFACRENALALTHLQEAMHWLHHRTRERMARGVEGTTTK